MCTRENDGIFAPQRIMSQLFSQNAARGSNFTSCRHCMSWVRSDLYKERRLSRALWSSFEMYSQFVNGAIKYRSSIYVVICSATTKLAGYWGAKQLFIWIVSHPLVGNRTVSHDIIWHSKIWLLMYVMSYSLQDTISSFVSSRSEEACRSWYVLLFTV